MAKQRNGNEVKDNFDDDDTVLDEFPYMTRGYRSISEPGKTPEPPIPLLEKKSLPGKFIRSQSAKKMIDRVPKKSKCPSCTFVNDQNAKTCTMCLTPLTIDYEAPFKKSRNSIRIDKEMDELMNGLGYPKQDSTRSKLLKLPKKKKNQMIKQYKAMKHDKKQSTKHGR